MNMIWTDSAASRLVVATRFAFLAVAIWFMAGCVPSKQDRLFTAIWNGDTNKVATLLQSGVEPNCVSSTIRGETPLIDAVRFGHAAIVRMLLTKGANPNATDREGHGPLYYGLRSLNGDSEEIIAELLSHGASPNGLGVLDEAKEISTNDPKSEICQRIIERVIQQGDSRSSSNRGDVKGTP